MEEEEMVSCIERCWGLLLKAQKVRGLPNACSWG